jgi:hypothetical protein
MTDPQNPNDPPSSVPPAPPAYGQPPAGAPQSQPQYGGAPQYASAPPPSYAPPADAPVPGRTMGIIAFILSFFVQLIALILGIIALVQSRKAGAKNGWAVAAIIISVVLMVLGAILFFAVVIPLITYSSEVVQACQAVGFEGTVEVRGLTVDCSNANR